MLIVKLLLPVLGQAVIDVYKGGKAKREALEWFQGEGYQTLVELLKKESIRFKNIFRLPSYTWGDIPSLVKKRPGAVYAGCKICRYIEGTDSGKAILISSKSSKVAWECKKGILTKLKLKAKKQVQIIHPKIVL